MVRDVQSPKLELSPNIPRELVSAIKERRAILFAGAGLSMCVGLPSWQEVMDQMADELGINSEEVLGAGASYHMLAEYYRIKHGSIGPLRSWMDRQWSISAEEVRSSRVHEIIVGLDFPIIYTTNYDRNIEAAFEAHERKYIKIASARDIAKARDEVTQIVKFHGDFDDDSSLVITETDYFDRLAFDTPLDIKFRSDALGRTVLFIGYSMVDINIRLLLHLSSRTWLKSGQFEDRPISYAFLGRPNPMQEAILAQWGVTVLWGKGGNPQADLIEFLEDLASL
jgi:hypothetical protein